MAAPGEITLIAQAALTNIALAYLREPRIAQAVGTCGSWAGPTTASAMCTPAAEYNLYVDPEAAKIVINAGFRPHRHLDGDPARRPAGRRSTGGAGRPGHAPRGVLHPGQPHVLAFAQETQHLDGSLHPDALTCAVALDERLILEAEMAVVDVETMGELTRGYLSVSHAILPDIELADPALKRRPPNAG